MKALIITRHYLDENLGGPNCSKAIIRAIGTMLPSTTLIYPEHDDRTTDMPFLQDAVLRYLPCYDHRPRWRKLLDVYCGVLHRFPADVKRHLSTNHYDIIFIDHSFTASSGVLKAARQAAKTLVTIHHNVEQDYMRDNHEPITYRLPYVHFALKAEREAIACSDINLTLTDADTQRFALLYPHSKGKTHTLGVFEYTTAQEQRISTTYGHSFVISGSLQAQQTESALLDFLNNYMPTLLSVCPDAQLTITGRNPSSRLAQACKAYPQIRLVPNPEDFMGQIAQSCYYIAPINTGSGLKLRIMDPLRLGLPVLAHDVSARGYEQIAADGFMLSYDDKGSFEQRLRELLNRDIAHKDVADSFARHFSPQAGVARLKSILGL